MHISHEILEIIIQFKKINVKIITKGQLSNEGNQSTMNEGNHSKTNVGNQSKTNEGNKVRQMKVI